MSECVKLDCCVPSPFGRTEPCPETKFVNSRVELACANGSVGDTIVIDSGQYESRVSQEEADRLAMAQAVARRNISPCKFYNEEQTVEVACEGDPLTTASSTVPAGSLYSLSSVSDANESAIALATTQAQEALVCQ